MRTPPQPFPTPWPPPAPRPSPSGWTASASSGRSGRSSTRSVRSGVKAPEAPSCSANCCLLAPVAAIDVDIAVGQVAGPRGGAALAEAEIDGDGDLASLHVLHHRALVIAG